MFVETDWDQAGTGKRKTSLPASSKAIKDPSRNVGPKSVTVDVYVCVVAQDEVVHLQGKHLSPVVSLLLTVLYLHFIVHCFLV